MFQDGSEAPPTYSAERGEPQQAVACYTSPLVVLSGPKPGHRALPTEASNFCPGLRSGPNSSCRQHTGKVRPRDEPEQHGQSLLINPRWPPATKLEFPVDTSRTPPFTTTQFHVLLTLSSKFFSIFHHCTCLLSVSGLYLALRGVYLALWTALPSSPTLERGQHSRTTALRAYHPLWAVATVKLDFDWSSEPWKTLPNATCRKAWMTCNSAMGSSRFIRHY